MYSRLLSSACPPTAARTDPETSPGVFEGRGHAPGAHGQRHGNASDSPLGAPIRLAETSPCDHVHRGLLRALCVQGRELCLTNLRRIRYHSPGKTALIPPVLDTHREQRRGRYDRRPGQWPSAFGHYMLNPHRSRGHSLPPVPWGRVMAANAPVSRHT